MKFTHFEKLHHGITGPGKQGVQNGNGWQRRIKLAFLLCLNNPAAQQIADPHQTIHIGPTGHQGGAQAGVLTG